LAKTSLTCRNAEAAPQLLEDLLLMWAIHVLFVHCLF
jgi:hypothetical protein